MSVTDSLVANNAAYAASFDKADLPLPTGDGRLAVVACMDARLNVFGALGLSEGDAHVIRNAGGVVTDDAIRSLAISQRLLGTEEIVLIHHTDCGMLTFNDDAFKRTIQDEIGIKPEWAAEAFDDLDEDVRQSIARIKASPFLPHQGQRARLRLRREHGRVAGGHLIRGVRSVAARRPDRRRPGDAATESEYTDVVAATNRRFRFNSPKTRLAAISGSLSLADQRSVGIAGSARRPPPPPTRRPVSSRRKPSNVPFVHVANIRPPDELAVVDVEQADVLGARVTDVQLGLVEREGQAVGSIEVVGDDVARSGRRVDAVHVAAADLALGAVALVVAVDAIRRIGEPHRTVGVDDDVVRAVQAAGRRSGRRAP